MIDHDTEELYTLMEVMGDDSLRVAIALKKAGLKKQLSAVIQCIETSNPKTLQPFITKCLDMEYNQLMKSKQTQLFEEQTMPERKANAKARAKREGFNQSSVVKSDKGGYFIAPKGVESTGAKKTYANCR